MHHPLTSYRNSSHQCSYPTRCKSCKIYRRVKCTEKTMEVPDWPFHNFRALKSVYQRFFMKSEKVNPSHFLKKVGRVITGVELPDRPFRNFVPIREFFCVHRKMNRRFLACRSVPSSVGCFRLETFFLAWKHLKLAQFFDAVKNGKFFAFYPWRASLPILSHFFPD